MRRAMIVAAVLTAALAAAPAAWGQSDRLPATDNVLTRYLDWADIHSAVGVGRLTVFPISLARPVQRLGRVLTMQQALDRGVLTIEELARARVAEARFTNKSRDHMIFLMNGELITGGRQNRVLRTDALLGPSSSTVLPTYCVEKGRWSGPQLFRKMSSVVPQGVRERAAGGAGQDAVWSEVKAANKRLGSSDAAEDMHKAMAKPENARRLREYRGRIVPRLPRGCVGLVVATGGRIVAADLFQTPELLTAMRDKVLDSYLTQYGWGPQILHRRKSIVPIPQPRVTGQQVQQFLRDCYRSRFTAGEMRGVGRVHQLRGVRSGQTLSYGERHMIHTSLMGLAVIPVRPPRPIPLPMPRPMPGTRR